MAGNSNPELAQKVAIRLGTKIASGMVKKFADGEVGVSFKAADVVGKHCYIVQPTCPPVNDSLMELYFMISACKRGGAKSVTVVCPYYGYARADRKFNNDASPVSSADVARMLESVGMDRLYTVDLHSLQTQGFVSSKVVFDDFEGAFSGLSYFLKNVDKDQLCIVSPDVGGMKRALSF